MINKCWFIFKTQTQWEKSGYTPFVCRLGFLISQFGKLGNGSVDQSQLALTHLLQYITGSESRALEDEVIQETRGILDEIRDADAKQTKQYNGISGESEKEAIEECVFAHKGILIQD